MNWFSNIPFFSMGSSNYSNTILIKKIIVKPKQRLSLQYHLYRDEWWKIISGTGSFHSEWEGWKPSIRIVKSGDTVEIVILRNSQFITLVFELDLRPSDV